MTMEPGTISQMIYGGWSVSYCVDSISFHNLHRAIRVHDSGHVEVVDNRDRLLAPSRHDPVWRAAIEVLGIELGRLEFNPFITRWAYPLGSGRTSGIREYQVRSVR